MGFTFEGFDNEKMHLQKPGTAVSDEVEKRVAELHRQGLSLRQIGDHLKIGATTVKRVLDRMKEVG